MSKMAKGEPSNEQISWGVSWAGELSNCHGIILDKKTILVLSNCMNLQRSGQRSIDFIALGKQDEQQSILVENIIPQMNQDRTVPVENNFAIMKLATPLKFQGFNQPACLVKGDGLLHTKCLVSGIQGSDDSIFDSRQSEGEELVTNFGQFYENTTQNTKRLVICSQEGIPVLTGLTDSTRLSGIDPRSITKITDLLPWINANLVRLFLSLAFLARASSRALRVLIFSVLSF